MPNGYTRSRARISRDYSGNDRGYYQKPRGNPLFSFLITFIVIVLLVAVILIFRQPIAALLGGASSTPAPTPTEELTPAPTDTPTPTPTEEPTPTPAPTPTPTPTPPPTEDLTVNAVGNIVIDSSVLKAAKSDSGDYDFTPLFANVKDQTSNADLTIGTLATTISGSSSDYTGSPKYNTPDTILSALKDAGFDVLNLAHAHIFDHGYDGAISTKTAVENQGMASAGLFTSKDDYKNIVSPVTPSGKTMPVAVLSYCDFSKKPSVLTSTEWDYVIKSVNVDKTIKPEIQAERSNGAQIVIVMLNWGFSTTKTPSSDMQSEAEDIIKAGADLVIGSGPDYYQKLEAVDYTDNGVTKHGIIAYSLGNLVSGNTSTHGKDSSYMLHVTFEKDNSTGTVTIKDASYVPMYVYVDSKKNYSILPAGQYANSDDLLSNLTSSGKTRVKNVWTEVQTLLGSTVASPVDVLPPPADTSQPADTGSDTDTSQPTDTSQADTSQPSDTSSDDGDTAPPG